ncbi:hypothetical protein C6P44_002096 [Monosporozyma unispora]|nr:hypothetical protein C6P44_002094 [Kazachstania unispora]KAG0653282.1 hypothetical protein C6P44_002096 [Kazachstania unispora]
MTDKNSSETAISSQDTIIAGQKENANLLQELVPEIKSIANSLQKIAKQQEKDSK